MKINLKFKNLQLVLNPFIQKNDKSYKIKIEGIRNFTGKGNIVKLINRIYYFLNRVYFIYKNYEKYLKNDDFNNLDKIKFF